MKRRNFFRLVGAAFTAKFLPLPKPVPDVSSVPTADDLGGFIVPEPFASELLAAFKRDRPNDPPPNIHWMGKSERAE